MVMNHNDGHAHVLELADALAVALKQTPVVEHFSASEQRFRTDPDLQAMMKALRQKAEEFQKAERAGTLDEGQLREFRTMQTSFRSHPLLRDFLEAQQAATLLMKETNSIVSQILGLDFGSTAGPASGGCC